MILERITSPEDVKKLKRAELALLCDELRRFLVESVARTGGHLASNLGAVELTVAIHRVYDTARDRLVFDVGHQCYVHKALTGRRELFSTLRQFEGLAGFPKPGESIHDAFVAGHASNSVSVALGMARARTLSGADYSVVALIGDGAMTGGLAYEGLNDAGASGEPLVVILNDNGMSIDPNVGGVAVHLGRLRLRPGYYRFKKWYHAVMDRLPGGRALYRFNHRIKTNLKKALYPCSMFEDMGFTYLGPVNGHNVEQLSTVLAWARELDCPVLVHVLTQKGKGYLPAEEQPERCHGMPPFDPASGIPAQQAPDFSYIFGHELVELAGEDKRICAITAAMGPGTGLQEFAAAWPKRFFDVGIAEGHAVSMAAGMAKQGMIPVFAVYSSFLQRSFDMLIHGRGPPGSPRGAGGGPGRPGGGRRRHPPRLSGRRVSHPDPRLHRAVPRLLPGAADHAPGRPGHGWPRGRPLSPGRGGTPLPGLGRQSLRCSAPGDGHHDGFLRYPHGRGPDGGRPALGAGRVRRDHQTQHHRSRSARLRRRCWTPSAALGGCWCWRTALRTALWDSGWPPLPPRRGSLPRR